MSCLEYEIDDTVDQHVYPDFTWKTNYTSRERDKRCASPLLSLAKFEEIRRWEERQIAEDCRHGCEQNQTETIDHHCWEFPILRDVIILFFFTNVICQESQFGHDSSKISTKNIRVTSEQKLVRIRRARFRFHVIADRNGQSIEVGDVRQERFRRVGQERRRRTLIRMDQCVLFVSSMTNGVPTQIMARRFMRRNQARYWFTYTWIYGVGCRFRQQFRSALLPIWAWCGSWRFCDEERARSPWLPLTSSTCPWQLWNKWRSSEVLSN